MTTLTPSETNLIASTAPLLASHGLAITSHFYTALLSAHPSLNTLFNTANQHNKSQPAALANALLAYATHIHNPAALAPLLERINHKHASLSVYTAAQYDLVGTYLLRSMAAVLGQEIASEEVLRVWGKAYGWLAGAMRAREEVLVQAVEDVGWKGWVECRIAERKMEADEIASFVLRPLDGRRAPSWRPGQFVSVRVSEGEVVQARQYSLSEGPRRGHLRITVRREGGVGRAAAGDETKQPGFVSNVLHEMKAGDVLEVSHPFGEFFFDDEFEIGLEGKKTAEISTNGATTETHVVVKHDSPIILLSAGVGITPMMAILQSQLSTHPDRPVTFIHTARQKAARAFHEQVLASSKRHANLKVVFFTTSPAKDEVESIDYQHQGRMDLHVLQRDDTTEESLHLSDAKAVYFICGPSQFMYETEQKLRGWGVEGDRIRMELFGTGGLPGVP